MLLLLLYRIRTTCKRHIIDFKLFDQKRRWRYKNKPHFVIQQWLSKLAYCVLEAEISIIGNVLVILDKGQKRTRCCSACGSWVWCILNDKILQRLKKYVHIDKKRTYTHEPKNKG